MPQRNGASVCNQINWHSGTIKPGYRKLVFETICNYFHKYSSCPTFENDTINIYIITDYRLM